MSQLFVTFFRLGWGYLAGCLEWGFYSLVGLFRAVGPWEWPMPGDFANPFGVGLFKPPVPREVPPLTADLQNCIYTFITLPLVVVGLYAMAHANRVCKSARADLQNQTVHTLNGASISLVGPLFMCLCLYLSLACLHPSCSSSMQYCCTAEQACTSTCTSSGSCLHCRASMQ